MTGELRPDDEVTDWQHERRVPFVSKGVASAALAGPQVLGAISLAALRDLALAPWIIAASSGMTLTTAILFFRLQVLAMRAQERMAERELRDRAHERELQLLDHDLKLTGGASPAQVAALLQEMRNDSGRQCADDVVLAGASPTDASSERSHVRGVPQRRRFV